MKRIISMVRRYSAIGLMSKALSKVVFSLFDLDIKFLTLYERPLSLLPEQYSCHSARSFHMLAINDFNEAAITHPDWLNNQRLKYIERILEWGGDDNLLFGINSDNVLASYGMLCLSDMSTIDFSIKLHKDDCYLCDAYTFPEYRGQGLHRTLTCGILNYAKDIEGKKRALVIVARYNSASAKNYLRLGFTKRTSFVVFGRKGSKYKSTLKLYQCYAKNL